LLKYIYRTAEVNIYNEDKDIFYSGNGILTMHTNSGGHKSIVLKNGYIVEIELPDIPATILLDSQTGDIIYKG